MPIYRIKTAVIVEDFVDITAPNEVAARIVAQSEDGVIAVMGVIDVPPKLTRAKKEPEDTS